MLLNFENLTDRNSSADEIGERYAEISITAWHTPRLWNFTTPALNVLYLIGASWHFRLSWLLLCLINSLTYLLTGEFFVDKYLWQFSWKYPQTTWCAVVSHSRLFKVVVGWNIVIILGVRSAKWPWGKMGEARTSTANWDDISSTFKRPIFTKFGHDTWIRLPRRFSKGIFENFSFRAHFPPKTSKLQGIKQVPYSDRPTSHAGDALQSLDCSLHVIAQGPGSK